MFKTSVFFLVIEFVAINIVQTEKFEVEFERTYMYLNETLSYVLKSPEMGYHPELLEIFEHIYFQWGWIVDDENDNSVKINYNLEFIDYPKYEKNVQSSFGKCEEYEKESNEKVGLLFFNKIYANFKHEGSSTNYQCPFGKYDLFECPYAFDWKGDKLHKSYCNYNVRLTMWLKYLLNGEEVLLSKSKFEGRVICEEYFPIPIPYNQRNCFNYDAQNILFDCNYNYE